MRPEPAKIWQTAAMKVSGKKEEVTFTAQQEKVLDYLWEHFRDLYLGSPGQEHSRESILMLSRGLSNNVPTACKRERFDFLARGLEQGNLTIDGWSVPLGPVYVKVNREENYSRQDLFRPHAQAEHFINSFRASLESPEPLDRNALIGKLLVSAVFFGGLIDRKWIRPFQESIRQGQYYQEGPILWVDMVENKQAGKSAGSDDNDCKTGQLLRRLVPDHLTRLLIYRYHRLRDSAGNDAPLRDPWGCMSAFMRSVAFPQASTPRSLTELLSWAFARYLTLMPHSLVAYAAGKLEATSLPTAPWLRFLSGRALPVVKPSEDSQAWLPGGRPRIICTAHTQKLEQQKLLSDLLKSLRFNKKSSKNKRRNPDIQSNDDSRMRRQKARRIINEYLQHNRSRMCATLQLLLHWALRLLNKKVSRLEHRQKQAIVPTSIDRYLTSIGYALLYVAEDLPLHNLEPQELETVYEQVALRLKHDNLALGRLRQFHGFMQVFYDVPEMEWGAFVEAGDKPSSAVSANIVTHEVYRAMLDSLGWGSNQLTRWQRLHLISLILLYRCGLRPSELQAMRLKDVQGVTRFELLIRNTRLNSVKTNSGIRRMPLSYMLLADELEFFLEYYKMRLEEDKTLGGGLLLTHPVHAKGLLADDELFQPIRKLLKSITKDENIRLYHLRHSLLTRISTMVLLTDRYHIEFPSIVPPPEEIELVRNLFVYLYRNENSGRKGLYFMAMLAGHASPETTTHHYCHLFDLILGHHLNDPANSINPSKDIIMALTGLQRSTAYELILPDKEIHPLNQVVANESSKFKDELRHPMICNEVPIKEVSAKNEHGVLPPWDEAISLIADNEKLALLRKNKDEWEYAAVLYEAIRKYDGRKIKTVEKVVHLIQQNYNKRYGGITIHLASEAKLIRSLIEDRKLPSSHIVAIHHTAKNLPVTETEEMKKKWADALGIPSRHISAGEHVPAKLRIKSMVTLKITTKEMGAKKIRTPRMSTGFMIVAGLICSLVCQGRECQSANMRLPFLSVET